jgi:uncharacterized membrane protein YdjX (TVP38/TMEM64 family)
MRLVRLLRDFLLVHRRAVAGMCILITAAVLLAFFFRQMEGFYRDLSRLQERDAPFFYVTFSALLILAFLTSIFPASLFGVLGGMLFGLVKGFALCSGALLAAALIAFAFARYFFRTASRQLAAKVLDLDRLEARLGKHGWRYALMIRASPIAPFGITSYALGLMPITLREYLLTTLAALPFLFACVYFGSVGGILISTAGEIDRSAIGRLAVAFSAATVLLGIVTFLLPKFIRRLLGPHFEREVGARLGTKPGTKLRPDLGLDLDPPKDQIGSSRSI